MQSKIQHYFLSLLLSIPFFLEAGTTLTLEDALQRSFASSPLLEQTHFEAKSLKALIHQASLYPNPDLEVELDQVFGNNIYRGVKAQEAAFWIDQLVETGGKRPRRIQEAIFNHWYALWEYTLQQRKLQLKVTQLFIQVAEKQQQVELARQDLKIAQEVENAVHGKIEQKIESPLQGYKSKVAAKQAQITLERLERQLQFARKSLALEWGGCNFEEWEVEDILDNISPLPCFEDACTALSMHPKWQQGIVAIAQKCAALEFEKAKRYPNVIVGAGMEQFNTPSGYSFQFRCSVPMPIFDRNQGAIQSAFYRMEAEKQVFEDVKRDLIRTLELSFTAFENASMEMEQYREQVVPLASQAFSASQESFSSGKLDYLDFLDAQRTLFEVRRKELEYKTAYQLARAELEYYLE